MTGVLENVSYKHDDYAVRARDPYAHAKYEIILGWLPSGDGLRVLNAGCGSGEMTAWLARNPTWRVDAIDVDPAAIALSARLVADLGLSNVRVTRSSIEEHRPPAPYDVIVSNDVLEHVADDAALLARLAALLEPGGTLCLSVPALSWLFGYHDEMLGHYRRYDRSPLRALVGRSFDVRECRYFGATLLPIALVYSRWLRRAYPVGRQGAGSPVARVLDTLLRIDQRIAVPVGTSLLVCATTKPNAPGAGEPGAA